MDHLRRAAGGDPCRHRRRGGSSVGGAERYFASAREVAEQMSNRLELADLNRLHARMLLDRGDTGDYARAAEMLEGRWPRTATSACPPTRQKPSLRSQALA